MKTIALTMIVKNEARSIARCLDSVAPWVDQMIVLDTGSTDDTIAIAQAHGATVYERRWTNDFAAARNAALARSDADWNLVLDADEWLTSGGEYLAGLRHDARQAIHYIRIDSDLGSGSNTLISSHRIPRILPRGVRYKGRIHEQPAHRLPVIDSPVTVRHDGYMKEQLDTKQGRNMALLLKSLSETPDEPYVNFQLAKQYDIQLQHAEAIPYYRRAKELMTHRDVPWYHDLVIRMIECLRHTNQIQQAMLFASDEIPYWDHSADFHFVVGALLLDQMQQHPEQGESLLPMIEDSWLKALHIGEHPELAGNVSGRGSFMAAGQLWALFDARKDKEKAAHYKDMQKQLYAEYKEAADAGRVCPAALPSEIPA
ncbi:MAG: glycosyltransferase family 2 protein [Lautropia sp.]|nr:glycosyltransferase family 2 protein [Lautropia sp.]